MIYELKIELKIVVRWFLGKTWEEEGWETRVAVAEEFTHNRLADYYYLFYLFIPDIYIAPLQVHYY